jgi:hypothetical protein
MLRYRVLRITTAITLRTLPHQSLQEVSELFSELLLIYLSLKGPVYTPPYTTDLKARFIHPIISWILGRVTP